LDDRGMTPRQKLRRTAMNTHRTSPPRLAAAIVGFMAAAGSSVARAQDLPEVRPTEEVFGRSQAPQPAAVEPPIAATPAPGFPFSVLEPDWQSAEGAISALPRPLREPREIRTEPVPMPAPSVEPEPRMLPAEALQLPEPHLPRVDAAAAKLMTPLDEAVPPPILPPTDAELLEESVHTPKPVAAADTETAVSADNLEGMLQGMLWITGTIGLGAVVSLWMLKLWLTRGGRATLPAKSLKLVDTLRIGPRCGVYLVQAEAHRVLVGIEHGKTMCLMPLPERFSESLDSADVEVAEEPSAPGGFERIADVFSLRRQHDERGKGASS